MLSAVAPIWDSSETWLVVTAVILWGFLYRFCSVVVGFLSACNRHVAGPDPARRGVRIPLQDPPAAVDQDLSFAGGSLQSPDSYEVDGRRPGGRTAIHEWRIFGGRSVGSRRLRCFLRHWPVSWLRASRCLLAAQEVRGRSPRRRSPPNPCACGRRTGVPRAGLRLRAGRAPSDPSSLDRSALSVGISGDGRARGDSPRAQHPEPTTITAPLYMVALIFASAFGTHLRYRSGLTLIPFVFTIDEAAEPRSAYVHVLGRRHRVPADAALRSSVTASSEERSGRWRGMNTIEGRTARECARQQAVNGRDVHRDGRLLPEGTAIGSSYSLQGEPVLIRTVSASAASGRDSPAGFG